MSYTLLKFILTDCVITVNDRSTTPTISTMAFSTFGGNVLIGPSIMASNISVILLTAAMTRFVTAVPISLTNASRFCIASRNFSFNLFGISVKLFISPSTILPPMSANSVDGELIPKKSFTPSTAPENFSLILVPIAPNPPKRPSKISEPSCLNFSQDKIEVIPAHISLKAFINLSFALTPGSVSVANILSPQATKRSAQPVNIFHILL